MNRQSLLTTLQGKLQKEYDPPDLPKRPVLEQMLYAVCREGTTSELADKGFARLRDEFFDWNEVRVSQADEVAASLTGLPDGHGRAERLIGLLQEVFETTFSFDLEASAGVDKKGLKGAAKYLGRLQGASDFAIANVLQHSLGGHAIPLDGPALRALRRLGLVDEDARNDVETIRAGLEHLVPKAKGAQLAELLSLLAKDLCWEDAPNCPACPLKADCPTGQTRQEVKVKPPKAEAKPSGRLKPR